ncbi:glycosyltransferase, partial [Alphaproteobacteria bacterium]|nr:glycosyltransferase [Alphaproteobacteria bacterium]
IEKYKKNIKCLEAPNRFVSIIGNDFPWIIYFWLKYLINFFSKKKKITVFHPPNYKKIKKILSNYQIIIGSGIVPGLLQKLKIKLDVFYPYSMGVELVQEHVTDVALKSDDYIRKYITSLVRDIQILGIQESKKVLCLDGGNTSLVLKNINVKTKMIVFPFIYKEENSKNLPKRLSDIIFRLSKYDVSFISHTRHVYINYNKVDKSEYDLIHSKHNDWIILAFSDYINKNKNINAILVLSDYGEDVWYSKKLINRLGINHKIMWIPKMNRKEILEIISSCDVGIGEFHQMPKTLWGGCGLEIMACGKPLIHSFKFKDNEFTKTYGYSPPPICTANSQSSLFDWFQKLGGSKELRENIGNSTLDWFNKHNGINSAKEILDLALEDNQTSSII